MAIGTGTPYGDLHLQGPHEDPAWTRCWASLIRRGTVVRRLRAGVGVLQSFL